MTGDAATIVAGSAHVETGSLTFEHSRKLGVARVPQGWDSRPDNSDLRILYSSVVDDWDPRIDDDKFPRPTGVIRPNQRFNVDLFQPLEPSSLSLFREGLELIRAKRGLCLGVPGAALIMDGLKSKVEIDDIITFVDDPHALLEGHDRIRQMVTMTVGRGKFDFGLQPVNTGWAPKQYLALFTPFLR